MKIYVGHRLEEGGEVYVEKDGKTYPLAPRHDLRNHSPDGFEWGYGGSGPAQLALAILADFLGPKESPKICPFCDSPMRDWRCSQSRDCGFDGWKQEAWESALSHYQDFKFDVIAAIQTPAWKITGQEIEDWLCAHP